MRAAINCAFANRQIIGHLARRCSRRLLPGARLKLLFDVSHNTCKVETHEVDGKAAASYVHRKGATRAFGPGNTSLPAHLRRVGQPVLIGGSMGTASWILAGAEESDTARLQFGLSRRRPAHEPAPGAEKMAWAGGRGRASPNAGSS